MKSFQVIRLNVSTYQDPLFLEREKQSLESLGLRYCSTREEINDSPLILLTNTHTEISEIPDLLKKTELIVHPNSGYDNLSSSYQFIEYIPTVIGHEIRAHAVVEWILSSFFEASITRPKHQSWDHNRKWDRTLLKEKEVVIFGHGHIGKMVTESLRAIGIKVLVIDPYQPGCYQSYSELPVKKYHALIVCCGLNEKNKGLFNKELFSHLSFDYFINGARGKLVHDQDLKNYLEEHSESKAYLDVFSTEPFQNEWKDFPQVTCSSHIAGVYTELDQEIINFESRVLNDFLKLNNKDFAAKYSQQLLSAKFKEGVII